MLAAHAMPEGFHARKHARAKEYRYRLRREAVLSPLDAPFAVRVDPSIDVGRLVEATAPAPRPPRLLGLRRRRRIAPPALAPRPRPPGGWRRGPRSRFAIEGEGFLRGMVRALVGTLVEVGLGRRSPEDSRRPPRRRSARRRRPDRPGPRPRSRDGDLPGPLEPVGAAAGVGRRSPDGGSGTAEAAARGSFRPPMTDLSLLAEPGSPEELLVRRIDLARLPRHVAIIMDGNGRWAKAALAAARRGASRRRRGGARHRRDGRAPRASRSSPSTPSRSRTGSVRAIEVWTLMNLLKEYIRAGAATRWSRTTSASASSAAGASSSPRSCASSSAGSRPTAALPRHAASTSRSTTPGAARSSTPAARIVADWAARQARRHRRGDDSAAISTRPGQPDPDLLIRTSGRCA